MAAVDQLPPVPNRGATPETGDPSAQSGADTGDINALFEGQQDDAQKQNAQEVLRKMNQDVGRTMRQFQGYAQQFPAAAKEADLVQKALDSFLRAIVKNAPDSD